MANHDFTAGCSGNATERTEIKNRACVCARGYEFDVGSRSCSKKFD
jgi:hypothetical protein